jgi:hypothetical protein
MLRVLRGKEGEVRLRDRLAAATWLSDRAFGKPPQSLAVGLLPPEDGGAEDHARWQRALQLLPEETLAALHAALVAADGT